MAVQSPSSTCTQPLALTLSMSTTCSTRLRLAAGHSGLGRPSAIEPSGSVLSHLYRILYAVGSRRYLSGSHKNTVHSVVFGYLDLILPVQCLFALCKNGLSQYWWVGSSSYQWSHFGNDVLATLYRTSFSLFLSNYLGLFTLP